MSKNAKKLIYAYKRINGKETIEVDGNRQKNTADKIAKNKKVNSLLQFYYTVGVFAND